MAHQETTISSANYKSRNRKRLIVLCDGTWQDSTAAAADEEYPSNVTRFSRALQPYALVKNSSTGVVEEVEQIVYYQKGVGTGPLEGFLGGATGMGVSANVRSAYSFLAHNYDAGDQIYFVGFSRGAYTARAIAGLVCAHGLLTKRGMDSFSDLYRLWYRTMDRQAKAEQQRGQGECQRRHRRSWRTPEERNFLRRLAADGLVHEGARNAVEIVACWDTVAFHQTWLSQTWIARMLGLGVEQLEFHNEVLSPRVQYGFHALALDERRAAFQPTMWKVPPPPLPKRPDSVGVISLASSSSTLLDKSNGTASSDASDSDEGGEKEPYRLKRLAQVWFSGKHTDVGGGIHDHRLSDIPLAWMVAQCRRTGLLAFDDEYLLGRLSHSRKEPPHLPWGTSAGATVSGKRGVWWLVDTLMRWLPLVSTDRRPGVECAGRRPGANEGNEAIHASVADRRFGLHAGCRDARRYDSGALTGKECGGRWHIRAEVGGEEVWLPQAEVLVEEELFKGRMRAADDAWVDEAVAEDEEESEDGYE